MTTFPTNPATALIIAEICSELQYLNGEGLVYDAIRTGAKENPKECIKMIHEQAIQAQSIRNRLADMIGEKTMRKIENLFV